MTLVLDLPRPVEDRIEQEARKAGVSPAELVAEVVKNTFTASTTAATPAFDPEEQKRLNAPTIALLESWLAEGEKPRTEEELAEAEEDLKTLMRNLNATRREAGERLLFPDVVDNP